MNMGFHGGISAHCFELLIQLDLMHWLMVTLYSIEESYRKQLVVDKEASFLNILDTAGQEEFSAMRDQHILTQEGFLLVYNVVDANSFKEIQAIHEQILRAREAEKVPIVLVGNKVDLVEREISSEQGRKLAASFGCPFVETSAKTRTNVEQAFELLVREVRAVRKPQGGDKKKGGGCRLM